MEFDSPDAFLAHVLWTFRSYLNTLVLVGGFAVRLYESHPRAAPAAVRVLRTFDADLATPSGGIPLAGESLSALAEAAGFQPEFRGDHIPAVMRLVPKEAIGGAVGVDRYTVEFLTPMTGPPVSRSGRAVVTSDIQAGVTARACATLICSLRAHGASRLQGYRGSPMRPPQLRCASPTPASSLCRRS